MTHEEWRNRSRCAKCGDVVIETPDRPVMHCPDHPDEDIKFICKEEYNQISSDPDPPKGQISLF